MSRGKILPELKPINEKEKKEMEQDKIKDTFTKIMESLTDEQREKAMACDTPEQFFELIEKEGVALPDEMFDDAAGGVAINSNMINSSMINSSMINSSMINSSTANAAAINANVINQNTLNQVTLNKYAAFPLETGSNGSLAESFKQAKATFGPTTAKYMKK